VHKKSILTLASLIIISAGESTHGPSQLRSITACLEVCKKLNKAHSGPSTPMEMRYKWKVEGIQVNITYIVIKGDNGQILIK
jgi:hypothetical protein